MKKNELKEKSTKDLEKFVEETKNKVAKIKAEMLVGRHKNVRQVKMLRADIARALTLLNEKKGDATETK